MAQALALALALGLTLALGMHRGAERSQVAAPKSPCPLQRQRSGSGIRAGQWWFPGRRASGTRTGSKGGGTGPLSGPRVLPVEPSLYSARHTEGAPGECFGSGPHTEEVPGKCCGSRLDTEGAPGPREALWPSRSMCTLRIWEHSRQW